MTDAEFIMRSEAREHKANGRAVYSRASRGGGKSCRLSSDSLTQSQWKKKNGELITVNMNKIITWREFKKLNSDLQRMYLENLKLKCNPRNKDVAEAMGVDNNAFSAYLCNHHADFKFTNYCKTPTDAWLKFIREESKADEDDTLEEPLEAENDTLEEVVESNNHNSDYDSTFVNTMHGNISFRGDPYTIFAKAVKLFDEGKHYTITISFREENEDAEA